jgi:ribokinase
LIVLSLKTKLMKPSIVVIGSSNTDMMIKADHLPAAGETLIGGTFFTNPGGKGTNHAVAAARLGGNVCLIAKTGNDVFGRQAIQNFKKEKIDTAYMLSDPEHASGVALITVDQNGENCIVVASGANTALVPEDLENAKQAVKEAALMVLQLEIPLHTVEYTAAVAAGAGVKVLLNPAPACSFPQSLFQHISIITPNETEATMLTGMEVVDLPSAQLAAEKIHGWGVETVIITLGSRGALILHKGNVTHLPSLEVTAVDVFNGALAVGLSEGLSVAAATAFAYKAAAISVTRLGALQSAPHRSEVEFFVKIAIPLA